MPLDEVFFVLEADMEPKLNENKPVGGFGGGGGGGKGGAGHDYRRDDDGTTPCDLDKINSMLAERMRAKMSRDFSVADRIRVSTRLQCTLAVPQFLSRLCLILGRS